MPVTDLTTFTTAVLDGIRAQFDGRVSRIDIHTPAETAQRTTTPAVLLELEIADEGRDLGDERLPLALRLTAHCLLSWETPAVQQQVREFAVELLRLVRRNSWGLAGAVSVPTDLAMGPGHFKPGAHGYESQYVTWQQTVYLGESIWVPDGVVPTQVLVGDTVISDVG